MSAIILQGELVHYEVLGHGRPVIFLHGWVGSWRYWIPSMQTASIEFRSYALDMWGFGYTTGSVYWGIDGDISHLQTLELGSDGLGLSGLPRWTKFGSLYFKEGGTHTFTVYLGSLDQVILDQWYFTLSDQM